MVDQSPKERFSCPIYVRVTPAMRDMIEDMAACLGLGAAAFIRLLVSQYQHKTNWPARDLLIQDVLDNAERYKKWDKIPPQRYGRHHHPT